MRKLIPNVFCLSLCMILSGCDGDHNATPEPPATPKETIMVVLVDVTNSLVQPENQRVAELAGEILEGIKEGTHYVFYPLHIEASRIKPLIPAETVPFFKNDVEQRQSESTRQEKIKSLRQEIVRTYKEINKVTEDRRTCIINMVLSVERDLKQLGETADWDPAKYIYQLIIISDMVEECGKTPIGEISLNKRDIRQEIEQADMIQQMPSPPDLSHVEIMIVFPLAKASPVNSSLRPSDNDLRVFWQKIFRHCGIKDEWFWNLKHIDWISNGELPERFKKKEE